MPAATARASSSHPPAWRASSRAPGCSPTPTTSSTLRSRASEGDQPAEWLAGSRARLATAVRAAPGDLDGALALLATHESDPQAICRHDEPSGEEGRPLVDTVVSLAMRPGVPELRVAAGQPCEHAFLRYEV